MDLFQSPLLPSAFTFANLSVTAAISQPIMYSFTSLLMVGSLALQAVLGLPNPNRIEERNAELLKRSVDSFIATESPIAIRNILCNIGSSGACVSGAGSGLVIAGPGKANPDCTVSFYSCNSIDSNALRFLYLDS